MVFSISHKIHPFFFAIHPVGWWVITSMVLVDGMKLLKLLIRMRICKCLHLGNVYILLMERG